MLLLLSTLSASFAASIFVIDDSDPDTEDLVSTLVFAGHDVERSSEAGVFEWQLEGDSFDLSDTDVVIWLDGNAAASRSMPESGQLAILDYVESGGGILSFGQNGTNLLNSKHDLMGDLLPLRSWTTWVGATYFCVFSDDPLCESVDVDGDGISLSGGHISLSSTEFGEPSLVFMPAWISDPDPADSGAVTYPSAVASTYGEGKLVQMALWGNSFGSGWQTPWGDESISQLVDNAITLLAQGPPRPDPGGPYSVVAGDVLTLDASGSTPRGDATLVQYTWEIDGYTWTSDEPVTSVEMTGLLDGPQTLDVELRIEDSDGEVVTAGTTVDILNANPVIDELVCPESGTEGAAMDFAVDASDPESLDTLTISWSIDGVLLDSGERFEFASVDDAVLNVEVVVEDDDDGVVTAVCSVVVENVPASIVLSPTTSVVALEDYTATPELTDPGSIDSHTWSIEAPEGVEVNSATGAVSWVPTDDQVGSHTLTLSVFDGTDTTSATWTVEVKSGDSDGDGIPDDVELTFGLDPFDADDVGADPDGDGRTSGEEVEMGLDPFLYQGPGAPTLFGPMDGGWAAQPLTLSVIDAEAPLGQALTHDFVLSTSSTLGATEATIEGSGVSGTDGLTHWDVDAELEENRWYYWTARASDAYVSGASMPIASFFLDTVNDPPGTPGINRPTEGAVVDEIALVVDVPSDPEGDLVSIRFYLWSGEEAVWTSDWVDPDGETAEWIPDIEPLEGQVFCWRAEAQDDDESDPRIGELSEETCFSITAVNEPPSSPIFTSPGDEGFVDSATPEIIVQNGIDPDGDATVHRFQLDTVTTFDSEQLQNAVVESGDDGSTSWVPETALPEDTWVHVRAQCADDEFESEWVMRTFFVSTQNDAPSVPVLLDPEDGIAFAEDGVLVVTNSLDPEGQAVTYDFRIQDTRDVAVVRTQGIEEGERTTHWAPGFLGDGLYVWSARAVDADGVESEWAEGRTIVVGNPDAYDEPEMGGTVTDPKSAGCRCSATAADSRAWTWALLVLGLVIQRRRSPRF